MNQHFLLATIKFPFLFNTSMVVISSLCERVFSTALDIAIQFEIHSNCPTRSYVHAHSIHVKIIRQTGF